MEAPPQGLLGVSLASFYLDRYSSESTAFIGSCPDGYEGKTALVAIPWGAF